LLKLIIGWFFILSLNDLKSTLANALKFNESTAYNAFSNVVFPLPFSAATIFTACLQSSVSVLYLFIPISWNFSISGWTLGSSEIDGKMLSFAWRL
jgi:hypothetical protein